MPEWYLVTIISAASDCLGASYAFLSHSQLSAGTLARSTQSVAFQQPNLAVLHSSTVLHWAPLCSTVLHCAPLSSTELNCSNHHQEESARWKVIRTDLHCPDQTNIQIKENTTWKKGTLNHCTGRYILCNAGFKKKYIQSWKNSGPGRFWNCLHRREAERWTGCGYQTCS